MTDFDDHNKKIFTKICCNQYVCRECVRQYILINNTISCVLCNSNEIDSMIIEENILTKKELHDVMKISSLGYNRLINIFINKYRSVAKLIRNRIVPFMIRVIGNRNNFELVLKEFDSLPMKYVKDSFDWSYFKDRGMSYITSLLATTCYIIGKNESIFVGDEGFVQEIIKICYEEYIVKNKARDILREVVSGRYYMKQALSHIKKFFSSNYIFVTNNFMPLYPLKYCIMLLVDHENIFYNIDHNDHMRNIIDIINESSRGIDKDDTDMMENRFKQLFLCTKCHDTELEYNQSVAFCKKCDKDICGYCGEFSHPEEPCDKKNMERLSQEIFVSCPTCAVKISKITGCDDMFCVQCHAKFDYKTGESRDDPYFHNIHYTEYLQSQMRRTSFDSFKRWRRNFYFSVDDIQKNYIPIERSEYQYIDIMFSEFERHIYDIMKGIKISQLPSRHLKNLYGIVFCEIYVSFDVLRHSLQQRNDIALEVRNTDNILRIINPSSAIDYVDNEDRGDISCIKSDFGRIIATNHDDFRYLKEKIFRSVITDGKKPFISLTKRYNISKNIQNFNILIGNLSKIITLRNRFQIFLILKLYKQLRKLYKLRQNGIDNHDDLVKIFERDIKDLYYAYIKQYNKTMPPHIRKLLDIADMGSYEKLIGTYINRIK